MSITLAIVNTALETALQTGLQTVLPATISGAMPGPTGPGASSGGGSAPSGLEPVDMSNLLRIHPYNGPCLAVFSFIGMLLQIPVIATYGFGRRPNVPITIMSSWYLYFSMSTFITAVEWTSDDESRWWSGSGWCDIDMRLEAAGAVGVLATQCVINIGILRMLRDRPRIPSDRELRRNNAIEAVVCMGLPLVVFVVWTFVTQTRYELYQYFGCNASIDMSAAYLVVYVIWLPILGLLALVTVALIIWRFARRGRTASLETVSFIPNMTGAQFVRMAVFALVVTVVMGPLSMYLGIFNIVELADVGIQALAWVHGKPQGWEEVIRITYAELKELSVVSDQDLNQILGISLTVRYVNVAIAWILFACYGTGTAAIARYRAGSETLHIISPRLGKGKSRKEPTEIQFDQWAGGELDEQTRRDLWKWKPELFADELPFIADPNFVPSIPGDNSSSGDPSLHGDVKSPEDTSPESVHLESVFGSEAESLEPRAVPSGLRQILGGNIFPLRNK